MPKIRTSDGLNLYYEEAGTGTPVVFIHEFAGDYRTWEPQMRHFSRAHRCLTFSQRGYFSVGLVSDGWPRSRGASQNQPAGPFPHGPK